MVADKYIGMLLAVVASFGIGASSIVSKIVRPRLAQTHGLTLCGSCRV